MDSAHLIEDLEFDLRFSTEERALQENTRLENYVKGSVMEAIEQVFDDSSMPGEVVRLERLEVDLGTVPIDGLETEMTALVRERLQAALHKHELLPSGEPVSRAQVPAQKQNEVDVLMHFLRTGQLPWYVNRRTIGSVEELANRVVRQSGEQFARELRSGGSEQVIGRLARQVSETSLIGVVRVMVSHESASIERLVRSLLDNCVQVRFHNSSAVRARTLIWEAILTELVGTSSDTVDPGRLAQAAVSVIAREMGDENAQTLLRSGAGGKLGGQTGKALNLIDQIESTPAAEPPTALQPSQSAALLRRRGQFAAALESGIVTNVSDDWTHLFAHDAQWIEALLRREGQRAAVRRRIAKSFPEPLLIAIVDLLEPTEREFVEAVVAHPEAFSREVNPSAHQASALKSQLWEFTLTYLLVERGSTFNRRSYMGSVLRQMAMRDGIDYEELLDDITSALRTIQPIDGAHKQMLDLLLELGEGRRHGPSAEPHLVASSVEPFADDGLDRLPRARLEGEPGDGTDNADGIERPARQHSERRSRLKRELQAGVSPWQVARARVQALLQSRDGENLAGQAGKALNLIDQIEPTPAEEPPSALQPSQSAARLRRRGQFEAALQSGNFADVGGDWAQLLAHDAQWVEVLLRREGQRAAVRRRIAEYVPESLLVAIVNLLEPTEREFVESLVAHHEAFSREVNPSAHKARALKSQLWEFTLTYLLVERGSTFNRRSYMGSVLRQMALRDGAGYEELLDGITSALRAIAPIDGAHKQILDLLLELGEGIHRGPPAAPDLVARSVEPFADESLDDLPRPRLQRESDDGADDAHGTGQLAGEHSERLSLLKRELQAGVLPWQVAHTNFSAVELEALVKALVGASSAGSAAALSSIEKYAGQSRDRKRFYAEILSCLVEDRPVDPELIVATSGGMPSELFDEPDQQTANARTNVEKVRETFEAGLESGILANVSEDWAQLLAHDAQWVGALLRREGQRAAVRKRIAESFPESLLVAIVDLLVPTEREFVESVVAHPEVFSLEANPSAHRASALKSQLWEFTLAYLLVERGSTFNRRSYMGSVLRQMASRDGVDYEELLDGMTSALGAIGRIDGAHKRMLDLLLELGEGRRRGLSAEPDLAAPSVESFAGDDLDNMLRRRLQGERGDGTDTTHVIEQLAREHPERLSQLKRELQSGALSWQLARTRFSGIELEVLVKALVGLGGAASAAFQSSIKEYAGQSNDRKRYYAEILSCLVEDRPVDLEVIVATSGSSPSKPHSEPEQQATDAQAHAEDIQSATQNSGTDVKHMQRDVVAVAPEAKLLGYLRGEHTPTASEAVALRQWVESGIEQRSDSLRRQIEFALDNAQAATRIIDLLPAGLLARVVQLLRSADYERIQRTGDLLGDASERIVTPAQRVQVERLKSQCILHYLFELGRAFSVSDFAREFARYFSAQLHPAQPQRWRLDLKQEVATRDRPADREIVREIGLGLSQVQDAVVAEKVRQPRAASPRKELAAGEAIYVENAGLVLAAVYVPRLFAMLNLTDGDKFKNADAAERGVHLLQYLATGLSASPEYELALNKLLCGVVLDTPVASAIEITADERVAIDGLLEAMIQHWKALGKTSVAGLRESFLQREGRLSHDDNGWRLRVQPRAFDMLLDRVPWGYATTKLAWMEEVIHVEWR
jgi:hypothetical protein